MFPLRAASTILSIINFLDQQSPADLRQVEAWLPLKQPNLQMGSRWYNHRVILWKVLHFILICCGVVFCRCCILQALFCQGHGMVRGMVNECLNGEFRISKGLYDMRFSTPNGQTIEKVENPIRRRSWIYCIQYVYL